MSRSRRPKCGTGRGCWVCSLADAGRLKAKQAKADELWRGWAERNLGTWSDANLDGLLDGHWSDE